MTELVFTKSEYSFQTGIPTDDDEIVVYLDTGSPITTISIPSLLQITGEPISVFRNKVHSFLGKYDALSFGVYGSQMSDIRCDFIPYLIKDIRFGETDIPYFLFWVDVTHVDSKKIIPTSTLFGFDYIRQGIKTFDPEDNFHIAFETICADLFSVDYALSNINEEISEIRSLVL